MDAVYSVGLHLSRNPDEAADLLQETFLRAYRSWHQFRPGTNCKAWLLTIVYNTFRNRYRSRSREPHTVEFDEAVHAAEPAAGGGVGDNPEDVVAAQVLDGEVERALRRLPQEFLEAIVLVDLQELTYEEAAAALACPVGTIRSRLSRGRRLLHQSLQRYAKERGLLR
jgi:RNA polymerase sigma-70 factor (ECF subfamily)